jgi:hypothetical protein
MDINRNNYESFFLLYADGELRAHERKAVEDFLAENEDVRIELEMLLSTVLPSEEIMFADKSFLYKETIIDNKLKEKLLLKIDDELEEKELIEINTLLTTNADANKEYDLLLRTKLDATEKIIFEEKHLLYKKERDNVIVFGWLRWAAAAVLVGFGLFFWQKYIWKDITPSDTEIASKPIIENKNNDTALPRNIDSNNTQNVAKISTSNNEEKENDITTNKNNSSKNIVFVEKKGKESYKNIATQNNLQTPLIFKIDKTNEQEQLATLKKENIIQPAQKIIGNDVAQEQIAMENPVEKIKSLIVSKENIVPLEDTYAKAIALSNSEKNENKILYLDEVKNNKAGGFFRKIKRTIERTANVKPGNTLQIAGFEIASK